MHIVLNLLGNLKRGLPAEDVTAAVGIPGFLQFLLSDTFIEDSCDLGMHLAFEFFRVCALVGNCQVQPRARNATLERYRLCL